MSKNRNRIKKTPQQANQYRACIQSTSYSPNSTTGDISVNSLVGSEELLSYSPAFKDKEEKIAPKKLRFRIKDYFDSNGMQIIILAILIPVLGWLMTTVISLEIEKARMMERLDNVKEDLANISSDFVDKDVIDIQIESIESDLYGILNTNIPSIEDRISKIEDKIDTTGS